MSASSIRLIGPFDFLMPTRLVWHSPAGDSLVDELATLPARSALIVTAVVRSGQEWHTGAIQADCPQGHRSQVVENK